MNYEKTCKYNTHIGIYLELIPIIFTNMKFNFEYKKPSLNSNYFRFKNIKWIKVNSSTLINIQIQKNIEYLKFFS